LIVDGVRDAKAYKHVPVTPHNNRIIDIVVQSTRFLMNFNENTSEVSYLPLMEKSSIIVDSSMETDRKFFIYIYIVGNGMEGWKI